MSNSKTSTWLALIVRLFDGRTSRVVTEQPDTQSADNAGVARISPPQAFIDVPLPPAESIETENDVLEVDARDAGIRDVEISKPKAARDMESLRAAHRARMAALNDETWKRQEAEKVRKWRLTAKATSASLKTNEELTASCLRKIKRVIKAHETTLQIKYSQLIRVDDYGIVNIGKWENERAYFIENVLYPALGGEKACRLERWELEPLITEFASKPKKSARSPDDVRNMTGIEYELYCSNMLHRAGWTTILTKTSGDQGVDIVADKNSTRLAIQCKRYSSAVGNAAVQEICAGMKFVHASHGAVVSNAPFTPQAKQLAKSTSILLLHDSELGEIDALLKKLAS